MRQKEDNKWIKKQTQLQKERTKRHRQLGLDKQRGKNQKNENGIQ